MRPGVSVSDESFSPGWNSFDKNYCPHWAEKVTNPICDMMMRRVTKLPNSAHTNRCQGENYGGWWVGGENWSDNEEKRGAGRRWRGCTQGGGGGPRPFGQQVMQSWDICGQTNLQHWPVMSLVLICLENLWRKCNSSDSLALISVSTEPFSGYCSFSWRFMHKVSFLV